jgi:hypothetical protein
LLAAVRVRRAVDFDGALAAGREAAVERVLDVRRAVLLRVVDALRGVVLRLLVVSAMGKVLPP